MKIKSILRYMVIVTVLCTNIGCDQVSKRIVRQTMQVGDHIVLLDGTLILTKVENTGAFLSLGHQLPRPIRVGLLTVLPMLVLVFAFGYLLIKKDLSPIVVIGSCFMLGGGAANVFDRVVYGSVTDFLHIDLVFFRTGIFNMADVSIMVGMALVLGGNYFRHVHAAAPVKPE